jgi:UDP-N-acetyl-D-galactosamine dehydrogenase
MFDLATTHIGVIGLGYVGLPLAVEFGKHFPTLGLDINTARIRGIAGGNRQYAGNDAGRTAAGSSPALYRPHRRIWRTATSTSSPCPPRSTVQAPDFSPLIGASTTVGRLLKPGDVAIYESTVYPGATEEVCVPILERESGCVSTSISLPATARSESTPATRNTG